MTDIKIAVVTGSTSGIGLAVARSLAGAGHAVMLNGLGDPGEVEKLRSEIEMTSGSPIAYNNADMSKPDQIAALVEATIARFGRIDIVVNNAGIQTVSPIEEFPVDRYELIMAINMSSAWHMTRLTMAAMKQRKWGRFINIASAHALVASPFKSAYVMSKHAVLGLTKTVALEGAQHNVRCNAISPGYVLTPLVENQIPDTMKARNMTREQVINDVLLAAQPTKEFVKPEDVAGFCLFLVSDAANQINGASLSIDGGWTAA